MPRVMGPGVPIIPTPDTYYLLNLGGGAASGTSGGGVAVYVSGYGGVLCHTSVTGVVLKVDVSKAHASSLKK